MRPPPNPLKSGTSNLTCYILLSHRSLFLQSPLSDYSWHECVVVVAWNLESKPRAWSTTPSAQSWTWNIPIDLQLPTLLLRCCPLKAGGLLWVIFLKDVRKQPTFIHLQQTNSVISTCSYLPKFGSGRQTFPGIGVRLLPCVCWVHLVTSCTLVTSLILSGGRN